MKFKINKDEQQTLKYVLENFEEDFEYLAKEQKVLDKKFKEIEDIVLKYFVENKIIYIKTKEEIKEILNKIDSFDFIDRLENIISDGKGLFYLKKNIKLKLGRYNLYTPIYDVGYTIHDVIDYITNNTDT